MENVERLSQENVEIARRAYEAFNRGDLDAMVADFAPDFEYVPTGVLPGTLGHSYRGPGGWKEYAGFLGSEFDDVRVEVRELVEVGGRVLASLTLRGRGKQSGLETTGCMAPVVRPERQGRRRAGIYESRRSPRSRRAVE